MTLKSSMACLAADVGFMRLAAILIVGLLQFGQGAHATGQHDVHFFLNGTGIYNTDKPSQAIARRELRGAVDILYTYANERLRFLSEMLIDNTEQELERCQLGWLLTENTTVWLGRMHEAGGYWNTAHHHGRYLQTSASRPAIEEFEDDGGVVPSHITGLTLQTRQSLSGNAGLLAAGSIGLAPLLGENQLEPFDLLHPRGSHNLGINGRLVYLPDALGENQFGLLIAYADIEAESAARRYRTIPGLPDATSREVNQLTVGAYVDWHWDRWRLLSTALHVMNDIENVTHRRESFTSAYAQIEHKWNANWTLFGRLEKTFNGEDSDYLARLPKFYSGHYLLGLRFDFARNQALTFEAGKVDTYSTEAGQFLLQWSASLP